MTMREQVNQTDCHSPYEVADLLYALAEEIDRLGNEVLLLHNRTGDWSKGRAAHDRPLAADEGSYK